MRVLILSLVASAFVVGPVARLTAQVVAPHVSQTDNSEREASTQAIRDSLQRIEKQVAELRQMIVMAMAPPDPSKNAAISLSGLPTKGDPKAPIVMVEFSDFQCPYCRAFVQTTQAALEARYVQTGKVQLVFWHLPLFEVHPRALKAAEAAECARLQDRFWEMHDAMFVDQSRLDDETLVAHAVEVGADEARFRRCLDGEVTGVVQRRRAEARTLGVNGTPTFLIARRQADGTVIATDRISGVRNLDAFVQLIDPHLSKNEY